LSDITERLHAAIADRYRLERELGQGGMATVWLAEDLKHDRRVALKVLKPELAAVLGAERFVAEIKTTAALQHPHILPLFDSGSAGGFLFYVMPYIEGETLRGRLDREKQLGIEDAVRIAREVADALDYAHRQGVIHRDIKPENILLHDGRPMVADFGIALAVSAAAGGRMTETGLSLGTPYYMSPEQATAEKEITARSDVYSLASVLYEMLTGNPPHVGVSAQQIIMKIITEPVAPVTAMRRSVPPNVAAAVARALEKLPADRFDSAKAFSDALANRAFTSAAIAVAPVAGLRRRSRLVTAAFAVSALAAGVLVGRGWGGRGSPGPEDLTRVSLFLGDSAAIQPISNLRLAISPSGRTLAYVGPDGKENALWVRNLSDRTARRLADTRSPFAPFFSPDGESIGFFTGADGRTAMKVVRLAAGLVNTVVEDSVAEFGGADWADDGYIYFTHVRLGLARIPAGGGAITVVTRPDSAGGVYEHDFPDVLPGSRHALVLLWRGTAANSHTGVVDLRTGAVTDLGEGVMARYLPPGYVLFGTQDGRILSAPFDVRNARMTGPAVLREQGVMEEDANGTVQFGVSANGTLVYQPATSGRSGLAWVDRDGNRTPIDSAFGALGRNAVDLSPDGRRFATGGGSGATLGQVLVVDLATRASLPLSQDVEGADRPVWTPDGRYVAFLASRDGLRTAWMRRADGSDTVRGMAPGHGFDEVAFDPLGRYTLFRSIGTSPGTRRLYIQATGDTALRPLLPSRFDHYAMTVSADGRWLAYVSAESGTPEVYVRPFPNVDSARFVVSVGGGVEPVWHPDGRELFYRGPNGEVLVATISTDGGFHATAQRTLFSGGGLGVDPYHRSYAVSRDGKRFLFSTFGSDTGAVMVDVVFNWRTVLERTER